MNISVTAIVAVAVVTFYPLYLFDALRAAKGLRRAGLVGEAASLVATSVVVGVSAVSLVWVLAIAEGLVG